MAGECRKNMTATENRAAEKTRERILRVAAKIFSEMRQG
jgi:hypothetical protein